MPTRDVEALVLRQYTLSEADRIVVFLTRDHGTLRAVARGARKTHSRMGACLEPLTHARIQFWSKEGSELGRIWQCEIIHSYLGKNPTLDRVYGFSYLAELANELAPENNPSALLFRLFLSVLDAGENLGCVAPLLRYFELWALRLNGWLPDYDYCSSCGKCVKDVGFYARIDAGQGRCRECAEDRGLRMGPEASRLLREVMQLSPTDFVARAAPGAGARQLERLTEALIEFHLEKRLRSYHTMKEVLGAD